MEYLKRGCHLFWADTVAYPPIGALVMYCPQDHDESQDVGWWRVRILNRLSANSQSVLSWVHPGVLAKISGEIEVCGDGQKSSWGPRRSCKVFQGRTCEIMEMSCHGMGEKPSEEDKAHVGYCEYTIRRLANLPSFFEHLLQAVDLLKDIDVLRLYCRGGKHRSLTLGNVLEALSNCAFVPRDGPHKLCAFRCQRAIPDVIAEAVLDAHTVWLQSQSLVAGGA